MKARQLFWLAPVAGLLALTACSTTSASKPETKPEPKAEAPAANTQSSTGYLVNLTKRAPSLVSLGDTFSYQIGVTAASDVADVVVTDTLPSGASLVSSEPAATQDGNKLVWKLGNMNRGETKSIMVTLKAEKQGELAYCATVSATPRACVSTMVGKPQLSIKKTGPETAQLGSTVTYTLLVQNTGNSTAKGVRVTDPVPEGLSSPSGQKELSFDVGDLPPGGSKTLQVSLRADKRGKVCNKSTASSVNGGKVESEACTTIVQGMVKIAKVAKDKETFAGRTANYEIVVSNTGDIDLTDVVVTDNAAPETVIAVADGATVSGNTTATWRLGTLRAGEKKNLDLKVMSRSAGRFCNTASVTTAQGMKDTAQDCTVWKGVTGVLIEMVDDPDPIQVGETSKFTVRVTNQGSTLDITGLKIVVKVPDEMDLVPNTVSDGGAVSGKTITWSGIAPVAPKAVVVRTFITKGIKTGDARTEASVTTDMRPDPIVKFESTTVY